MASDVPPPGTWWREAAACRGMRPGDFFLATKEGRYDDLGWASVCPTCPVRADCLAYALRAPEVWGVWGGFSPRARAKLAALLDTGSMTWDDILRSLCQPPVLP